ncbi:MAG: histidine kinase [Bacteroidota bacterium]
MPVVFPPALPATVSLPPTEVFQRLFYLGFLPIIAFFYLNYYVLIPRFWQRYNHGTYVLVVALIGLIFHTCFSYAREYFLQDYILETTLASPSFRSYGMLFLFFTAWLASSGLWLFRERRRSVEQLRESEHRRVEMELHQLKGQLNPHFLFNTLNGLYGLALSQDPRTPKAILKLAGLLDYVLSDLPQEFVPLQRDVDHLRHFIELNRLRLTDKTQLDVDFTGDFSTVSIAPVLMLPFVENAFKYGVSSSVPNTITISVSLVENTLSFQCQNQVFPTRQKAKTHGIGIDNTRQRLALLYPDQHQLQIKETPNIFIIDLSMVLAPQPSTTDRPTRKTSPPLSVAPNALHV